MTLSRRDRYILIAVVTVGAVAALWLMALSPKRDEAAQLDKDIAAAQQQLDQAKQEKVTFAQAQLVFPGMYASLGRLGKAVPSDEEVPSLLVQLNHAAAQANVDFRSVALTLDESAEAAAPPPPPPAAGTTGAAGATPAGATGATGAAGATASGGSATIAPAEFKKLPFEYKFEGGFYKLEKLIHNINALVERRNQEIAVAGRLITIEGFAMKRGKVTILATSYVLPADQGLFGGATPEAPANADPAAPQAASAGSAAPVPPTAAVTSP
jgi:type IV pilus assembly PilO-like protein